VSAKFFLHPAPLDELLEPSKGLPDRLFVVNPHAQTHSSSLVVPAATQEQFLGLSNGLKGGHAVAKGRKNPRQSGVILHNISRSII
jgi:hypothetical protein